MVLRRKLTENPEVIKKFEAFLKELWIEYKDINLYILAFVHRSFVNEQADLSSSHNERLEFLWDAVLELVITSSLYRDFPEKAEWDLTDLRSWLVRWRNLAIIARKLDFSKYLVLWKWENKSWWRENDYILANTVEAVIWAIYEDLWMDTAAYFIKSHIYSTLDWLINNKMIKDSKSLLQEFSQSEYGITPVYKVLEEVWPDHEKTFLIWVFLWDIKVWEWNGSSKKKAQEEAATNSYSNKNNWNITK